jgi:hypothetical protein
MDRKFLQRLRAEEQWDKELEKELSYLYTYDVMDDFMDK